MTEDTRILDYKVSKRGLQEDVAQSAVWCSMTNQPMRYVACLNPHSMYVAKTDQLFREALDEASLLLPDGAGILFASNILGASIPERVAGMEFFLELSKHADKYGGWSYFFLGSSEPVLNLIRQRLAHDFPNITFAGSYSPPYRTDFTSEEQSAMVQAINSASPTVLWVGMTAPKQEKWIYSNRSKLNVPLAGAIGAVFDFYAGTARRAPEWARSVGLEWLIRFLREPRRLWRRNLISTPVFLGDVLKAFARQWFDRKNKQHT